MIVVPPRVLYFPLSTRSTSDGDGIVRMKDLLLVLLVYRSPRGLIETDKRSREVELEINCVAIIPF